MKITGPLYMIVFEDCDISPEVFAGEDAERFARKRFEQVLISWNASLFKRIDNGIRDRGRCRETLRRLAVESDATDFSIMQHAQRNPRICTDNRFGEPIMYGGRRQEYSKSDAARKPA